MEFARISKKITIPLAVMLQYIPTVREDWMYIKKVVEVVIESLENVKQVCYIKNDVIETLFCMREEE